MSRTCLTVVLAAGEGKRMASTKPKVLHEVAGLSMLGHVLKTCEEAGGTACAVVVGTQAELVAAHVNEVAPDAKIFEQTKRKGTAHAVLAAREAISDGADDVVVLYGDVPLIRPETILQARATLADGADVVVLGFETDDPGGYGRLLMDNGQLVAIREDKDATDEEKGVTFCNSGIMAFRGQAIIDILDAIGNDNSQGEYYLTDAVEIARDKQLSTLAVAVSEEETIGVNDRSQLAGVEALWQMRR